MVLYIHQWDFNEENKDMEAGHMVQTLQSCYLPSTLSQITPLPQLPDHRLLEAGCYLSP